MSTTEPTTAAGRVLLGGERDSSPGSREALRKHILAIESEARATAPAGLDVERYRLLDRVAEAGSALNAFATWSALGRPEVQPFVEALRALHDYDVAALSGDTRPAGDDRLREAANDAE